MSSSPERTKRKRDLAPLDDDEKLEIDINLPEPPSKKARRKEKKDKKGAASPAQKEAPTEAAGEGAKPDSEGEDANPAQKTPTEPAKRSEYGVWIGNLPFGVSKDSLRAFFLKEGGIDGSDITRVHMPTGEKGQNKGFAYVDFATPAVLEIALALSERLTGGRRVLIKNAKSFEGRPQKAAAEEGGAGYVSKKEPSKRVFVGNLSFDVTKDELSEHFAQAGQVEDVFMATFEDSGKSKGFAWVTFAAVEAAEAAVRGFVLKSPEREEGEGGEEDAKSEDSDEDEKPQKKAKKAKARKWFINRIHGRVLRCEFAEDAQTRYKKRFGKEKPAGEDSRHGGDSRPRRFNSDAGAGAEASGGRDFASKKDARMKHMDKDQRQDERRKKFDARRIAPGKALANTQRASGAIVEGRGSKTTFD